VSVGVISKVFRILEAIDASPSGLGLTSICSVTRLNKSTAHRFLKHLAGEGYLIRAEGGKYLIGPKLSQMGGRVDHRATLQAVSRPILSELWKSTRETVNLATLDQGSVLYIEVLESPHEFRLSSRVGTRRSLHATGLGKALAAFLHEKHREQILSGLNFQAVTPNTIKNLVQFRQELEKVRRNGYAVDDEEATLGARCVSAPILGSDGEAIGAISVSGPTTRVGREQVDALAAAVVHAANTISSTMGFHQAGPAHETQRRLHSVSLNSGLGESLEKSC
jgi:IclR family KDG regulon transcriptional repressor